MAQKVEIKGVECLFGVWLEESDEPIISPSIVRRLVGIACLDAVHVKLIETLTDSSTCFLDFN